MERLRQGHPAPDPDVTEEDLRSTNQNVNCGPASGPVWDAAFCGADSDEDGQSNGQELGDPDSAWTVEARESGSLFLKASCIRL